MIAMRVKYRGRKISVAGFGPEKYQMLRLAQVGVDSIKRRVAAAVGSDDAPMKPLKAIGKGKRFSKKQNRWVEFDYTDDYKARYSYAGKKKAVGLPAIRNLIGFGLNKGHMLDDFRVTYADPKLAKADITTRMSRIKARINEMRSPWWGFSGADTAKLAIESKKIFGEVVSGIRIGLNGGRRAPVWMDPLGIGANAGAAGLPVVSRMPVRVAKARARVEMFKAGRRTSKRRAA